jgi:hypothetical protein
VVDAGLLVKVLAFMASTVSVGWFLALIVIPAFRGSDYRPPPEITVLMGSIFTSLAGSLAGAYFMAKHVKDKDKDKDEDGDDAG